MKTFKILIILLFATILMASTDGVKLPAKEKVVDSTAFMGYDGEDSVLLYKLVYDYEYVKGVQVNFYQVEKVKDDVIIMKLFSEDSTKLAHGRCYWIDEDNNFIIPDSLLIKNIE